MNAVELAATNFLKYDYPATVDMAKSFLTLVSAVLVASLTFSDKIIEYPKADNMTKRYMIFSWLAFIVSVVCCGAALCLIFGASFVAAHISDKNIYPFEPADFGKLAASGWVLMLCSGVIFVVGLVCLIGSAIRAARARSTSDPAPQSDTTFVA